MASAASAPAQQAGPSTTAAQTLDVSTTAGPDVAAVQVDVHGEGSDRDGAHVASELRNRAAGNTSDGPQRQLVGISDFSRARQEDLQTHRKKKLRAFYRAQNDVIDRAVRAEARARARAEGAPLPPVNDDDDETASMPAVKFAINASFACNVVIFVLMLTAAISSGSLAVIAASIDSSLDLLSNTIVFVAAKMVAKRNPHKYPVGKTRLEPLAIVVFASVMGAAALQLMVEGIQAVMKGAKEGPEPIRIEPFTYGVLAAGITIKFCLMLLCYRLSAFSPSAAALAQDHRNDVMTNSVSIVAVVLASRFASAWWVDPGAAMVLAVVMITSWADTGREYIMHLAGVVADPEVVSHLTFIAFNHDARILQVDTVRAYHAGTKLMVECDIVLPRDMPLHEAHDIGEALQKELEAQAEVERAFVHLDYETEHRAVDEHAEV